MTPFSSVPQTTIEFHTAALNAAPPAAKTKPSTQGSWEGGKKKKKGKERSLVLKYSVNGWWEKHMWQEKKTDSFINVTQS